MCVCVCVCRRVCVWGANTKRAHTVLAPPLSCGMWIYLPGSLFEFSPLSFHGEVENFCIVSERGLCVSSLQEVSALKTNTEQKGLQS